MDENKLNPMPEEPIENENEIETPENPETEAAEAEVQTDVQEEAVEEIADEQSESSEAADYDELCENFEKPANESAEEDASASAKPKKKKKKGAIVAVVILVALLLFASISMISAIIKTNAAKIDLDEVVLSVEDVDSSAAEFYQIYMYYYGYNSYYQYSEEELKELAIKQLVFTNALYAEAVEAGYELNDEDKALIEEQLASVTETAESASMSADEYLDINYCEGFTLEMFRQIVEKSQLAQRYYTDKMTAIEDNYKTAEGIAEIEAEYEANKIDYDLADVSYWYFDASEETAKDNAQAVVTKISEGMSFTDAIRVVTGDSEAIPNNLKGYNMAELTDGDFAEAGIEWIFAKNEDGSYKNGTGSATSIDDGSVIYVLYANNVPSRDETLPVTSYYIQVDVSDEDTIKTQAELKLEAKATAEALLKDFEKTAKSEEDFIALMTDCNNGDNDLVNADAFAGMKNDGTEAAVVEDWAFDAERKVGDYTLVDGGDCYYILFYAEKAENTVWYQAVLDSMITNEAGSFENSILEEYEAKTVENEEAVSKVIAYVANMASSQYGY